MTSGLLQTNVSDADTEARLGDTALVGAMVEVEAALARVQGRHGIIPSEAAGEIGKGLTGLTIEPSSLRQGMESAGVPVPALVAALRKQLPDSAAQFLHWGATSQDIVDTALVLCLRPVLHNLSGALTDLGNRIDRHMMAERSTPMLARTRFQQAVPTFLGLRFAGWLMPLVRHRQRLEQLRPRVMMVQFGGAAGNLAALGDRGAEVAAGLARELDLDLPALPWHAQRDGLFELGCFAAGLGGSLGKIGMDVLLASQNEVAELRQTGGGGSSTMPNKSNPVTAEALVSIARRQGGLLATLQQSLVHAQDRDGSAWALEWAALPDLLSGLASALTHARNLVSGLQIDRQRMAAAIDRDGGLSLAEALSFSLARHMPRAEAQELVKAASVHVMTHGGSLVERVRSQSPFAIDQENLRASAYSLPSADGMIDAVHAAWTSTSSGGNG